MAGTLKVTPGTRYFSDPPFSKFGTESCPHAERGVGTDTVSVVSFCVDDLSMSVADYQWLADSI